MNGPVVNRPMTPAEWSLLLMLSIVWSGSFFFIGVAVRELPPLVIVAARVALGALILLVVLRFAGLALPRDRRVWAAFFGMGLLNNVIPFLLVTWGQTHIASGVASILNATTPLFTVVVAHFMTADEKMTGGRFVGVLVGLIGVAVMIGGAALESLGVNVTAQFAILGAAVSYAFAGVFGRRFRAMGVAPLAAAAGQVTASSIILLPIVLAVGQPWAISLPSVAAIGSVIGLALLSTAVGYGLYFRVLATAGATNLLLVTFLMPVGAILLGIFVLGETLQLKHVLGMMFIGIGLASIDGRPWRATMNLFSGRRGAIASHTHGDGI